MIFYGRKYIDKVQLIGLILFQMLNDEQTLKYIDGVATHWYSDDSVSHEIIKLAKTSKKDVFLLASESCKY